VNGVSHNGLGKVVLGLRSRNFEGLSLLRKNKTKVLGRVFGSLREIHS
jgi:hypothetical protein